MNGYLFFIFFILCFITSSVCSCVTTPEKHDLEIKTGAEQTGIYFPLLVNKNVGLVANHTSFVGHTHLADSMLKSAIRLSKIFAPEHGFRGTEDAGSDIGNGIIDKTGIPFVSLYGSKLKPSSEDLSGIDVMVFDIQDIGVRFYTYISTLHYVMEACAENHIPLLILDRPNPLGYYTDGPVLEQKYKSFVGMHPIPVVYGMTIGELAGMINDEGWLADGIKCDLRVIPCINYDHNSLYQLPINPSPNLNSMEAIYLYPSLCFFEGTVMSVGRGTDSPFRVTGHPDYPVKDFSFTPTINRSNKNPVFLSRKCFGLDLRSLNRKELQRMNQLDLHWLIDVYKTMAMGGAFFTDYFNKLAGNDSLRNQIINELPENQIRLSWESDLNKFRILRKKYLLYNDYK